MTTTQADLPPNLARRFSSALERHPRSAFLSIFARFVFIAQLIGGNCLAQAAPKPFNTVKEILETVPKPSIIAIRGGGPRAQPAALQTNAFLRQTAGGKNAILQMTVKRAERAPGDANAWRIEAEDETVRVGGTSAIIKLMAYLKETETAAVAKVKKGDKITVAGTLGRVDFTTDDKLYLHVDLNKSKIN